MVGLSDGNDDQHWSLPTRYRDYIREWCMYKQPRITYMRTVIILKTCWRLNFSYMHGTWGELGMNTVLWLYFASNQYMAGRVSCCNNPGSTNQWDDIASTVKYRILLHYDCMVWGNEMLRYALSNLARPPLGRTNFRYDWKSYLIHYV